VMDIRLHRNVVLFWFIVWFILGAWQITSRVSLPIPRAFIPENLVRPGLYEHAFSHAVHDPPPARRVSLGVTDFLVFIPLGECSRR
jgi:hypothetical protein